MTQTNTHNANRLITATKRLMNLNCKKLTGVWLSAVLTGTVLLSFSSNVALAFLGGGGPPIYVGPIPNTDYKAGYVLARSIVLDPDTNEPILVGLAPTAKKSRR